MCRLAAATAIALVIAAVSLGAQKPMKPTTPGTPGDPEWQGVVQLSDGRTFVTDGGLAVDTALARPAAPPARQIPGKVLESYFTPVHPDEYGFADLSRALSGKTYTTPKGIPLNATYVTYLRRVLPSRGVRLRVSGEMDPVVVVVNDKVVAVLMPVRK